MRGLDRSEGHRAGVDSVRRIVRAANDLGIEWLTLFAFSSENWNRPKHEVDVLMKLPEEYFDRIPSPWPSAASWNLRSGST